jgi:predicted dehydrogenase
MSPKSDYSRRQFLVRSASVAGVSIGLRTTGELAAASVTTEVRLGFVGLGDRGRQLLGAALATSGVRVVALCDVDPRNLKRALDIVDGHEASAREVTVSVSGPTKASGPRGFTDLRALVAANDVDAIVIATPVFLHREQTITALMAGKHVYCEKPMALDASECRSVLDACREAEARGQIYQSGLQRRYNPRYRESIRFLHDGGAGDLLFVRAQWHAVGSARKSKPWIYRRAKSGDIVLEQASHQFDVFNWVFDATPVAAIGMGGRNHPGESPPVCDVLDHYGAVIEYPHGAKVHFSHLSYAIPDRRFSGIYELVFGEKTGVDLANALTWDSSGRTRELCKERGNETKLAMASFIDCVLHGRRPDANYEAAYRATITALLCRQAVDSGQRVTWSQIERA